MYKRQVSDQISTYFKNDPTIILCAEEFVLIVNLAVYKSSARM